MSADIITHVADNGASTPDDLAQGSTAPIIAVTRMTTRLLIFNRPSARNALTRDMRRAFAQALRHAEEDPAISSVILSGAGACFCAGVDIKESRAEAAPMVRPNPGEALRALSKPVIAAIDGPCITGGLEIALSCSFIIATERSVFADTHAKVGLFPAWGLSVLLPGAIGTRRARQMMLTAMQVSGKTAYDWGIANELTAPDTLLPRCLSLADAIRGVDQRLAKEQMLLMRRQEDLNADASFAEERDAAEIWQAEKRR